MGGKFGCFTIQNEVISEKWKAIKRLKKVISNLPDLFLRWKRAKGRSLGQGRCVSWASLARWCLSRPLAQPTFPKDWGLQA
jgi:hypothetical protein